MVQFGSIWVLGPFSGEPILDVGSGKDLGHSVRVLGLESILPGRIFLAITSVCYITLHNIHIDYKVHDFYD